MDRKKYLPTLKVSCVSTDYGCPARKLPALQGRQSTPTLKLLGKATDYGRLERKKPSLHGRTFNPNPKFLGMAAAYFVCHIGPIFQISLIYAFIGCP